MDRQKEIDKITEPETEKPFGKFGTAEELLHAYNALESEFTKRCQSLKRLQAELDALRAQVENETSAKHSDGNGDGEGDGAPVVEIGDETNEPQMVAADMPLPHGADDMLEYAEMLATVPEVMNACIARYKRKLLEPKACYIPVGGAAVIVPADRPKTLSEAKALADKML